MEELQEPNLLQEIPVEEKEPTQEEIENKILETALNDLNASYSIVENAMGKMNRTASTRVLLAAISYPLDTKKLSTIQKDEEAQLVLMHSLACVRSAGIISSIMEKRYNVKAEAEANVNKDGE